MEAGHCGCIEAANAAKAAVVCGSDGPSAMETVNENAYERMQAGARLERAREVAAKANAAALAAEKARDAAEAEVEALELALNPKRRCTDKAAVEEEESAVAIDDWDLADHRRESTCAMNRRAVELIEMPARQPREPRTGQHGYLHHTRHGLTGLVARSRSL